MMQELFIIGIVLTTAGIVVLSLWSVLESYIIFELGIPVDAHIKDCSTRKRRHHTYVKFTWEYEYDGITYTYQSKQWHKDDSRETGYRGALLVKKQCPSKVYGFVAERTRHIIRNTGLIITVVGTVFIAIFFYMRTGINFLTLN